MSRNSARLWVYGILVAIGSMLLFVDSPDYFSSRSFKYFQDTGHVAYFALIAGMLSRWRFIARWSLAAQWAIILLITLMMGVSVKFIQAHTGRTSDMGDVLRDLIGSLLVLVFGSPGSALKSARLRMSLQVVALALLLHQLWPLSRSLIDEAIARQQFPLLSGFETPFELDRWGGSAGLSIWKVYSSFHDRHLA